MNDHLQILRRQVLTQAAGPVTRDELLERLPLVGDEQSKAEARDAIELLISLEYLRAWQYEGVPYVQRTEPGTRQLRKLTATLDPALWGALAFQHSGGR